MPELPEVETVVRSIAPKVQGRTVVEVYTSGLGLHMGRVVDEAQLHAIMHDARIMGVRRRGKYILIDVCKRPNSALLMVHLGMSGRLTVAPHDVPRPPHTHVVLTLDDGHELRFVDPRRFGQVRPARGMHELEELAELGPEPMEAIPPAAWAAALASSRAPIKAFLLDQRRLAGVGNIYVCEALFELGVHPGKVTSTLRRRAGDVLAAVRLVLQRGLDNRGTTLRDYVDGSGQKGGNQSALKVYGREGLPCLACGRAIRRRVDAGRSTFFCPTCQKR